MVAQRQGVCEVMPTSDPCPEVDGKVGFAEGLEGGGKEGTALIADRKLHGLWGGGPHWATRETLTYVFTSRHFLVEWVEAAISHNCPGIDPLVSHLTFVNPTRKKWALRTSLSYTCSVYSSKVFGKVSLWWYLQEAFWKSKTKLHLGHPEAPSQPTLQQYQAPEPSDI